MHVYLWIKATCMYMRCAAIIYFPSGGSVSAYFHLIAADSAFTTESNIQGNG